MSYLCTKMGRENMVEKSTLTGGPEPPVLLSLQMKAVCVCHPKLLLMSPHFQSSSRPRFQLLSTGVTTKMRAELACQFPTKC